MVQKGKRRRRKRKSGPNSDRRRKERTTAENGAPPPPRNGGPKKTRSEKEKRQTDSWADRRRRRDYRMPDADTRYGTAAPPRKLPPGAASRDGSARNYPRLQNGDKPVQAWGHGRRSMGD